MSRVLTIGISTRALFDLEQEHQIYINEGAEAFVSYEIEHEKDILPPGPAFGLIESFLKLNEGLPQPIVKVMIMSQNSADGSLRIFNSLEYYGIGISQAAFTTGRPIVQYLKAYNVDLYLSADEMDVQCAIASGVAAGLVMNHGRLYENNTSQIRIAFDGDCVLFNEESQLVFDKEGLSAFDKHEKDNALVPLNPGPFANLLQTISQIQRNNANSEEVPIRTALITARTMPAHERVIRTLRNWNVRIDEVHFMGGMDKTTVLKAFGADIFFDDSKANTDAAASVVLSARVIQIPRAI